MSRRDAFSSLRRNDLPDLDGNPLGEVQSLPDPTIPKQPLDLIPVAPTRKKRNRDWDRAHQAEKITYRGIPQSLQDAINNLAENLSVPRDELVRAIFEFSLSKLNENGLAIQAHPKAQRMTLFPEKGHFTNSGAGSNPYSEWLNQAFSKSGRRSTSRSSKNHSRETRSKARWEERATYRLPLSLKGQIKELADEYDVPVGEIALLFLDHGLTAYEAGELHLVPSPRSSGLTLFPES